MQKDDVYDVIIVGAAAAGLTAAIYTARQGMSTLVIGKDLGGQAILTNDIQNYPGYDGIDGFTLVSKFEEQAKSFNAEIIYAEVQKISDEDGRFTVKTPSKQFTSQTVILAFGKTPRDLGVPGEDRFKGRGLSYCATCDGPLYRGKTVAVVGSAEHAVDGAVMLSDIAEKVYLIFKRDRPVGDEDLLTNLEGKKNVVFVSNSNVSEIRGERVVESIKALNLKSGSEEEYKVDGVFVELGYVARTDFVKDFVNLNDRREVIVDKECRTSHKGVFAAGDVTDMPFKQIVISAGQGSIAALSAYNYLQKLKGRSVIRGDWKSKKKK
ncbi:MAG: NAD(P)/FAD-dependent oxidoreductase [Nitrososphaerales archaeon]